MNDFTWRHKSNGTTWLYITDSDTGKTMEEVNLKQRKVNKSVRLDEFPHIKLALLKKVQEER